MAEPQPSGLQFFANAYPDGIVGADTTGTVTVMNAIAARMLNVTVRDALGMQLADVLRLQDSQGRSWLEVNRPFQAINIQTGIPEQSWLLPDGQEVLVTARMVRIAPRGVLVGVGIGLRSGRGRARLDRDRSDLVATVSHELRSPLTGVKGFVQAMLNRWDRLSDEQKRLMLTTVSADADRLSRLIAELLDVARLDTGRLTLHPRPSDASVLVQRAVHSVRAATARQIEYDVSPALPPISFDPDKFTQVITNLIENGVRHGDGTVQVTGRLGSDPVDGTERVTITVDDQGGGIDPEMRMRAFTKFWKHGARGGSGLGMYIVNGLVTAQGGRVDIGDAPGGGARVTLYLLPAEPE